MEERLVVVYLRDVAPPPPPNVEADKKEANALVRREPPRSEPNSEGPGLESAGLNRAGRDGG